MPNENEPEVLAGEGNLPEGEPEQAEAKTGNRNNRDDRARIRAIRAAAKQIHDTTVEMEPDDDDARPEPEGEPEPEPVKGNALKTVSETPEELRVANYIVLFGGRDLEGIASDRKNEDGTIGEYFAPGVDLESSYTKTGLLYVDWEHGMDPEGDGPKADDILGYVDWKTARKDERGVWVERVLSRRASYMEFLETLIREGLIGNSTEAVSGGVEKAADGAITRWPLRRDTLTVCPMEPRMLTDNALGAAKALGLVMTNTAQAEAADGATAEAATEAAPEPPSAPALAADETESIPTQEKKTMEMTTELQALLADVAKNAAAEAVKAYQSTDNQPVNDPGFKTSRVEVTEDETDRRVKNGDDFKSLGHQLKAIYDAANPDNGAVDRRLYAKASGLSEGVPADGGFLLRPQYEAELLKRTYEMGQVMNRCRKFSVGAGANSLSINAVAESSRADGSRWGGVRAYWMAEAGEKTASKPTFEQVNLQLRKLGALCYATDEALADAAQLESTIMYAFPEEMSFKLEDAIINGVGGTQPVGIKGANCTVSVAKETGQAAATVTKENIDKMWSRMWGRSRQNAVWLVNQDVEPQLYGLYQTVGTGGLPVYLPPGGLSASPYSTLYGRPLIPVEYAATLGTVGDIIFADFSQYALATKGGVQAASSIHVRFIYDESVFRFVYRVDGAPLWKSTLTPYSGSSNTLSPFVTLATRA